MKRLAEMFSDERKKLEGQWDRGDNVTTEDLRQAMVHYRALFRDLLETAEDAVREPERREVASAARRER